MKQKMKQSITTKIILSFLLLISMLLLGQILFNKFFAVEYSIKENKTELENLFYKIQESYSDEFEVLYDLTEEEDSVKGFSIQIFSSDTLIYSSKNFLELFNNSPILKPNTMPEIIGFSTSEFSITPKAVSIELDDQSGQTLVVNGKFLYEDEYRYVSITKSVESIEASISLFTRSSIIISGIILLIGIIVIIIIARGISLPIKNIETVSQKLSELDFSYKADENTSLKELSSLATSINSMSYSLYSAMYQLKNANMKLQEDIEYQRKMEENRKQFIANVSHEMKTPLALLQLYCENLRNCVDDIDKDEYCEIIVEESQRLDTIVKDMLNVSSIENGFAKIRKEEFHISESCKNIVLTMSPLFQGINLKIDVMPGLRCLGDKKQLEEAMRNYIVNAISHTPENGNIIITLEKEQGKIIFSVYNDGENIPEKELKHIWESFYKSDKSRTRSSSGNAGLGLYIVKIIVENHLGEYSVKNVEKGVVFSFNITTLS